MDCWQEIPAQGRDDEEQRVQNVGEVMDLNWLEDFICFARTQSFTGAAQERNITQSAYSRRIQSLELWVGTALIDRKSYPAQLTETGEEFLPVAKATMQQLLLTRDDIRARDQGGKDFLSFAAPHSISIHHLMPLLHKLETALPSVRTRVASDNLHTCCQFLTEGRCDFLMCYRHSHIPLTLDESQFSRINIGHEALVPVCAPGGNGAPFWTLPGSARRSIPYLAFAPGSFLGAVIEHELKSRNAALRTRHMDAFAEALKSLALQGSGVAWLPKNSIERELQSKELVLAGGEDWTFDLVLSVYANPALLSKRGTKTWAFLESG